MTIKMYEKYGAGTVVESSEVNWKMSADPSHLYYFYPIKRPVPTIGANGQYEYNTSDLENSVSKCNYFRVTGASKVTEPRIVICSPVKTQILFHFESDLTPIIDYAGSGYSNGLEYDPTVGVKATLDANGIEISYQATTETGPDTPTTKFLPDHLFVSSKICLRINMLTGSADKVRYIEAQQTSYTGGTGSIGTEVNGELKANSTYLYCGLTNTYTQPTSDFVNGLNFVSNGNMIFEVPLSTSPEAATTKLDEYIGADLYTPYINTQLRCAASEYTDVGNSPGYRIVFTCKIF